MAELPTSYDLVRPLSVVVHPQDHAKVYAGVSFESDESLFSVGALYRSDNMGHSWTPVTETGPISPVNRVVFAPNYPEFIYLGTGSDCHWCDGNGIWRSTNGGLTWDHLNSEVSGHRVLALVVHPYRPVTLLAGVWSGANDGRGIYRSSNGGASWQPVVGLDEGEERKVTDIVYNPVNPQVVYAATHGGLRVSDDGGTSWQTYPGPMGNLPITALAISVEGTTVRTYAGTVGGSTVPPSDLRQAGQTQSMMSAGVYVNVSQWHFLHLPLVQR